MKLATAVLTSSLLFSTEVLACEPSFGPGGTCYDPPETNTNQRIIPYFNTKDNKSIRFGITNPTESRVIVNVTLNTLTGDPMSTLDIVLDPKDMLVSSLSGDNNNTFWYIPDDETACYNLTSTTLPISEGYLTITSAPVTAFGPAGFCDGNYTTIDLSSLFYEYSIWDENKQRLDIRIPFTLQNPIYSSWTQNGTRSTSVIVYKENPECETVATLLSNRNGSYKVGSTSLCGSVSIINFGTPFFNSSVNVTAEKIFNGNPYDTGWLELSTSGSSVVLRSAY